MKIINEKNYLSDEGKVFQHKETKTILGWGVCLGDNDSIDNYNEIECPEEYKGNTDYDNLASKEKRTAKIHEHKTIK